MSTGITRKRGRPEEREDIPPAKREPLQDEGGGSGGTASVPAEGEGQAMAGEAAKKDEEFWFEDGTVILVARDVEFRVYKGLLANLSSVFKAIFAEPHMLRLVSIDEQQALSCPVVHVSDSPEDLRRLLRVCFTKKLGRLYVEWHPSYHDISAAIRLGDKYKITELYSQSLEYLKHHFPSTFDGWVALKHYGPPGWDDFEEIGVVNLARLTGELSILPSALIACICGQSTSTPPGPYGTGTGTGNGTGTGTGIGHGFVREDGSREHLSADDLTVCFDGKTNLRTATIAAVLRTFKPVAAEGCKVSAACEDALRGVLLNLEGMLDVLLGGDPFAEYEDFVDDDEVSDGLGVCKACAEMVRRRSFKERKDVWDRLPELLDIDIPGWRK